MAKSKRKIKESPRKKSRTYSKPSKVVINKQRGRETYFINLPKGEKSTGEIRKFIESSKLKIKELPHDVARITFLAEKSKKEKQGFSNLYMLDEPREVNEAVNEIYNNIVQKPQRDAKDYMKKINRLKSYINTIIIDFEVDQ